MSNKSNQKSKSMKKIKPISKEKKVSSKKITTYQTIQDAVSDKSTKKRKSKSKSKSKTALGHEIVKLASSQKKIFVVNHSEQIKSKNYTPLSSVKDTFGLKFNKIRSPLKMPKSPEQKTFRPAKLDFLNQ